MTFEDIVRMIYGEPYGNTVEPFTEYGTQGATLSPMVNLYSNDPSTSRHEMAHYLQYVTGQMPKRKGGLWDYISEQLPVNQGWRQWLEQNARSYE